MNLVNMLFIYFISMIYLFYKNVFGDESLTLKSKISLGNVMWVSIPSFSELSDYLQTLETSETLRS
jgi:hypothetical protein